MSFKPKTNKKIEVDEKSITTLDDKHNEIINNIYNEELNIPKLKEELKSLINKLKKNNSIEESINIENEIASLKRKIYNIRKMKKKYLLENSKYIFNYFESKKNISNNSNKKKILDEFFNVKKTKLNNENTINDTKRYLSNIDDSFIDINDYIDTFDKCKKCNGELVSIDYDGVLICKNCSNQYKFLIEYEKPSYKEPPKEVCFYAYKRINHFREILAQFQAKETTQISDNVIENIKNQIKKERLDLSKLSNNKTKDILKKLGYNKYYEHIPFIKEKLGIKPPNMSIELENKLCNLFLEIQKPYSKYCPNVRVNFLNYYYVLYKMCELLGEDEYLPHFYMLKDPVKRMEQDEIWKKICKELNWEFIPTPKIFIN
jgi:uncharacterized coiled-coil protein SlyX